MSNNEDRIKSLFETYFDGCYGFDPMEINLSTFEMGVCKLDFEESTNTLSVHLRRKWIINR